mgnify:CR=1 FL=1
MIDDIDRIMSVMVQAFDPHWGEAWTRRQIEDALTLPATGYVLAGQDGDWPGSDEDAAAFALTPRAGPATGRGPGCGCAGRSWGQCSTAGPLPTLPMRSVVPGGVRQSVA